MLRFVHTFKSINKIGDGKNNKLSRVDTIEVCYISVGEGALGWDVFSACFDVLRQG